MNKRRKTRKKPFFLQKFDSKNSNNIFSFQHLFLHNTTTPHPFRVGPVGRRTLGGRNCRKFIGQLVLLVALFIRFLAKPTKEATKTAEQEPAQPFGRLWVLLGQNRNQSDGKESEKPDDNRHFPTHSAICHSLTSHLAVWSGGRGPTR